jgi:nucleoside-diphosphate-sugar epimerase
MKVLLTGHDGYIGSLMGPMLIAAGHDVVGLDNYLFEGCSFGERAPEIPSLRSDIRDVVARDLEGFDAIVHLAGISDDPVGALNPGCTYAINHRASVRLARVARQAGVKRFLFSSSCSLYGAAGGDAFLTEDAEVSPITAYGKSKALVERDVSRLATDSFSPTFLRNATVFGTSPQLRTDLVVNNLVGIAYLTGEILIKSDGTPWRPLVHIEDVGRVFLAALEAPRERIHDQALNVGSNEENYRISQVANLIEEIVPNSRVVYAEGGGPDRRSYRVDFTKMTTMFPGFTPSWTVRRGVEQLLDAYRRNGLTSESFQTRFVRLQRIKQLVSMGQLDADLRRTSPRLEETRN